MGLDFVEIVFEIEKNFDVKLSPEDFDDVTTGRDIVAGDLYELLLTKLHLRDIGRYDFSLNYDLWRRLQGVIGSAAKVPCSELELSTPLHRLFPRETRAAMWQELRDTCPYRVRDLEYPRLVRLGGFSLAIAMVLIEQFQIWQLAVVQWVWPLLGIFGVWMLVETYLKMLVVLRPWRTSFPSGINTVKDLCRTVLATNYDTICEEASIPSNERSVAVWRQLTGILADTLGVDEDTVTFRSRLVRDLGMA